MSGIKIALTGKMRSGKTSAAIHLLAEYGFETLSFGGKLKLFADEIFACSDVYKPEPIYEDTPIGRHVVGYRKPRRLYQDFGQAMRQLDPDIWIKHAEAKLKSSEAERIVIDDLRQPNEYEWARANGFVIIRVNAPEYLRIERAEAVGDNFDIADLTHETEKHVDTFAVDYEVNNNGDIRDLERQIDEIMTEIGVNSRLNHFRPNGI